MRLSLAYTLAPAIRDSIERPDLLRRDQAVEIGQAGRALFEAAVASPQHDRRLLRIAIAAVVRTFATEPEGSERLLRQLLDPGRLRDYGYEELPDLASELDRLFAVAPSFCTDVYVAAFSNREVSDEMAALSTGVLPLTMKRSDSYNAALYHLADIYPDFLDSALSPALEALVEVRVVYALQRTYGRLPDEHRVHVPRPGKPDAVFRPDSCRLDSERIFEHDDAVRMLNIFEERLKALAAEAPDRAVELVEAVLALEAPTAVWARVFRVAGDSPKTLAAALAPLAASPVVLGSPDLSEPAIFFCAAAFPHLEPGMRCEIERSIVSLPEGTDPERIQIEERHRDQLLARLPRDHIASAEALARYDALLQAGLAPAGESPVFEGVWHGEPYGEREWLAEAGVDVDADANRRVQVAIEPVDAFANDHLNEVPAVEAAQAIEPALRMLRELIDAPGTAELQVNAAWGHLAAAARAISRQPALARDDPVRDLARAILLEASRHPEPRPHEDELTSFDEHVSWGGRSPRVDAAEGLMWLASRVDCERAAVLATIAPLRQDPVPAVRYKIARTVVLLRDSEPDLMWSTIDVLEGDASTAVRNVLVDSLRHLLARDRRRVLETVKRVNAAVVDAAPGAQALRLTCLDVVADLYFRDGDEQASQVLSDALGALPRTAEQIGRIVFRLREACTAGPVDEPDARLDGLRGRAVGFVERAVVGAITAARAAAQGQPARMDDWSDEAVGAWKQAMQLVDGITRELFFASGAYRAREESRRPSDAQRRYYFEAAEIIDALVDVGAAAIAHHLLETLEFYIDVDPRPVFMRIVSVIKAGQASGYQYDGLAEPLFVRIVERYIAAYRTLLQQDQECSRALVDVLDIFVRAGWPSAHRITYGLNDIYR